tara:strand:+ start:143 stop:703 length:561 start_codon:yes stop_codon:yes gene_type:complete
MGGDERLRELDADGVKQSLSLSKKISEKINENTIVYSSPFTRALQSLEPLLKIYNNMKIYPNDNLKEINIGKSDQYSKHQIIEKMWNDKNFKVTTGESQKECYERIQIFLNETFKIFKEENKNIIFVTHGNLIGIILKYFFNLDFNFQMWKKISMPDFYEIVFDDNYIAKNLKRDIENVDNLFYVK